MLVKYFFLKFCFLFLTIYCFCQQNTDKEEFDSSKLGMASKTVSIDYNSDSFIRIFDGIQLSQKDIRGGINGIPINSVKRTNDTTLLKSLGIKDFSKPYMFLSSGYNDFRDFVYSKLDIDQQLKELNLPLIINGKLILLNDYNKLNRIDKNRITKIKFDKNVHLQSFTLPMGAIIINTN